MNRGYVNSKLVEMEIEELPIPQHEDYNVCNQYASFFSRYCEGIVIENQSFLHSATKPTYYRVVSINGVLQPALQLKSDVNSIEKELVAARIILNFLGITFENKDETYWFMVPKGGFAGCEKTNYWIDIK